MRGEVQNLKLGISLECRPCFKESDPLVQARGFIQMELAYSDDDYKTQFTYKCPRCEHEVGLYLETEV